MTSTVTPGDRLAERMLRYASIERLMLLRNFSYGAAAVCMVVLVGLVQVGANEIPLMVAVVSASFALPLWFVLGGIYECYIFLGPKSYPHLRTKFAIGVIRSVMLVAGLGSIGSAVGVIWFLMPLAAWLFGGACLLGAILVSIFHFFMARWWYSPRGPGGSEGNDI